MEENKNSKEYRDQSKDSEKEISEALDRIIKRARIQNDALMDMLNKMNKRNTGKS